jgi:cytochrome c5
MFTVVLLLAVQAMAISDAKKQAIAERIKPVGSLCLQGDDCGGASVAVNAGPKDPAEVYSGKCAMCHDTGAGGAPKVGVVSEWTARISQGNQTMYDHAVQGFNGMPAMGLCMDCTDEDIHAIVDLMVSKSQ